MPDFTKGELEVMRILWEHGELIMSLSSDDLDEAEFLQVARSVGH